MSSGANLLKEETDESLKYNGEVFSLLSYEWE